MPTTRPIAWGAALGLFAACAGPLPPGATTGLARVERLQIDSPYLNSTFATAVIEGVLPDACTEIDRVIQSVLGAEIQLEVTTWRPADVVCPTEERDFRVLVALHTSPWETNLYLVNANGVEATYLAVVDPDAEELFGPDRQ